MSQLIQIKNRIKTIETIQKVTHAMRLIAMSSHGKLKQHQTILLHYKTTIEAILKNVYQKTKRWENPLLQSTSSDSSLLIVIGAQRGLCGSFNSTLMQKTKHFLKELKNPHIITVGKQLHTVATQQGLPVPVESFDNLTARSYVQIAQALTSHIFDRPFIYHDLYIISMYSKSFFSQIPRIVHVIPQELLQKNNDLSLQEYVWEQKAETIMPSLFRQAIIARLSSVIYDSLIAEQAARFLSMDSSTRNAQTILEETKLQYNKLRQSKITTQLIELITESDE
jgi:F-type H+-transporting ATPase subunit gamma